MGICSGSASPGIEVVPNKYTINVENEGKKQINPITLKQNNNTIQANTNSTNNIKINKIEEPIKNENQQIEEKKYEEELISEMSETNRQKLMEINSAL